MVYRTLHLPMGSTRSSTEQTRTARAPIADAVREMYTDVATDPPPDLHFPVGRKAAELVGYPADELEALPVGALEGFAGVGYPFQADGIGEDDTVLDVGSGSGTDLLVAAQRVGPEGRALGLDFTPAMLAKALENVQTAQANQAFVLEGDIGERVPLPDESVDVVTSNGVFNLVPDKEHAFAEAYRVLRPGGRLQIADIVVNEAIPDEARGDETLWAACIAGAVLREDYLDAIEAAGFEDVEILERLDYFDNAPREDARETAAHYEAEAIVLTARRPSGGSR